MLWLAACTSAGSGVYDAGPRSAPPPAVAADDAPARDAPRDAPPTAAPPADEATRCLPVVAAECGCVYPCGVGTLVADKRYRVQHAAWKGVTLEARVDTWCVDGACTEAFFAEILCLAICAPKAADPSCRCAD